MKLPEIRTLPGTEVDLPAEAARLYDIAYNLWWTWSPKAHLLFSSIDPAGWTRSRNPVSLLQRAEAHAWEPLLLNESFMGQYHAVANAFDRYMRGIGTSWFHRMFPDFQGGPVAYLSTEFGWHECVGIYSGGLGILSGDHCKSASDLGIPFVGVGLMYRRGYFQQTVGPQGDQQHFYPDFDLRKLPVLPVAGPGNKPLRIAVPLPGRKVLVRLWKAQVGRAPVLLLDSDVRENDPADRPITSMLYVAGREMRVCQEMILGVGGAMALEALGIRPSVWHLNEGHSAFLSFERMRKAMDAEGIGFDEARARVSKNSVFTTHTPVPAGNETFDADLVRAYVDAWRGGRGEPAERYLDLGRGRTGDDRVFNMTVLAIRTSDRVNGVSRLHGQVADRMWKFLWPGADSGTEHVGHITNGVHTSTWIGPELGELLARHLGKDVEEALLDPDFGDSVLAIPDAELWAAHEAQKRRFIVLARERVLRQLARHGRSPEDLRGVHGLLGEGVLTLGFARRFATYKRADLIFRDAERLRAILSDPARPVQIVFAGKAHPADLPGQAILRRIFQMSIAPEFHGRIVFLENYDMRVARFLVQGVDVWINTPRRPLEASGTSGMKVAANGGLNLSVFDGWWCEGYDASHGWVIGSGTDNPDAEAQDHEDAESFYRLLETEVAPAFYRRDASGLPSEWIGKMKRALGRLAPRFSTHRMVRDYVQKAYVPAARAAGADVDEAELWAP